MTTTDFLEKRPLYYASIKDCTLASKQHHPASNPRYPYFRHGVFHAGDKEQFTLFRDKTNGQICVPEIDMKNNVFYNKNDGDYNFYKDLNADCVDNTFNYLFYKFKKGIFVKIKDNKLDVFLPFSNAKFINEWSGKIQIDPRYPTMVEFMKEIYTANNDPRFDPRRINKFTNTWYANNCLLRSEFPIQEKDTSVSQLKDMFLTLCKERTVPDIELFVNKRDFPLLKKNLTEPYNHIFGDSTSLLSHKYDNYSPILSPSTTDEFADIGMPTASDWSRVSSFRNKYFSGDCVSYPKTFDTPWDQKKSIAVFRGSSTGCGVDINTNVRLKLVNMSGQNKIDFDDNLLYLDAGITKWNYRPKKLEGEKYLKFTDPRTLPFGLSNYLTIEEQSKYKYIINVDGHVSAYRLSIELSTGSVVLLVDSKYKLWFKSLLKPYVHYVPVKADLSDLYSQIDWCKANDEKCRQISRSALDFYKKYLLTAGILDYLQSTLFKLKQTTGVYLYTYITPSTIQFKDEVRMITSNFPENNYTVKMLSNFPNQERSYSLLEGLNWVINFLFAKQVYIPEYFPRKGILYADMQSKIYLHSFLGKDIIIFKENINTLENKHEMFIGQKAVNNILKCIPNFAYTYSCVSNRVSDCIVVQERIKGVNLREYISSDNFNVDTLIYIFTQVALILQFSLNTNGFVHNNLICENIILKFLPLDDITDYNINLDEVYRIRSRIIPCIVDYTRSSMIYNSGNTFMHHSYEDIFSLSVGKDISTLFNDCISLVLSREVPKKDLTNIFKLSEYFGQFNRIADIRRYVSRGNIVDREPINFFYYLTKTFDWLNIEKRSTVMYTMYNGNSKQVFDYFFSPTIKDKVDSFTNLFANLKLCTIPQPKDKLNIYYVAQTLYVNLISTYNIFINFLERSGINKKGYENTRNSLIKYLDYVYRNKLQEEPNKSDITVDKSYQTFIPAPYTENDFNLPEKILNLPDLTGTLDNLFTENNMLKCVYNYGSEKFGMSSSDKSFYREKFEGLVKIPDINLLNNKANIDTLKYYAEQVYTKNAKVLSEKIDTTNILDCKDNLVDANKYLQLYNKIIAKE